MSRDSIVEKLGERHEGVDYFYTTCHNNGCWDATCLIKCSVKDGKIIGMASLLKTDYYPLPEIFPWVSCVFVEKEFRGDRISGKLIDAANRYAKEQGFAKTYIPTEYTGLYERYGYIYVKDIVNYGGGTDRLYVKEL